jgi:hypothetical protein
MDLVEQLVAKVGERDGSAASASQPALLALWRRCNRRLRTNQHIDWLRGLIRRALPVSLDLANGLFYYWTGNHGIVDAAAAADIRGSVIDTVRSTIRTGDDLARILTATKPYLILRLITQTGSDVSTNAFAAWSDYLPGVLIEGARKNPEVMVPEIATLVGDEQSGATAVGGGYPPIFINRYKIDQARVTTLFGDFLDEALTLLADYAGDNAYAVRAKDAARIMLDERRGGGAGTGSVPATHS